MPGLFRDDNSCPIADASALVPFFVAAQTFNATTGAATAEVSGISTGAVASAKSQNGGRIMVRIATGTNDVYYAFGAAGAAGSYTAANMVYLPQRWVEYISIDPNLHKSFYHLQITAAGAVQVTILGAE